MENRTIEIDGQKIQLVEVAENGGKKLLRFDSDWRITGADFKEIKQKFPEYKFEPFEMMNYDFLIEENGKIQYYYPDGTEIEEHEIESLE